MIEFHKQNQKPTKIDEGKEAIWFTYPGGTYVSDNLGNPRLMSASTMSGTEVPVGVPVEPNMLFYNRTNDTSYISTEKKWVEIPTKSVPGTGGGSSNAGNVMINDPQNFYVSNDVEGALAEIAEKFPWFFGRAILKDYNGNVAALFNSVENFLAPEATNKPNKNINGWLSQRKASDNQTYGTYVDSEGSLFTKVGSKFNKIADSKDFESFSKTIGETIKGLSEKTITGEDGIRTSGTIEEGIIVGLTDELKNKMESYGKDKFVKISGDTMTGNLSISNSKGNSSVAFFGSEGSGVRYSVGNIGSRFSIYDVTKSRDIVTYSQNGDYEVTAAREIKTTSAGDQRHISEKRFVVESKSPTGARFIVENSRSSFQIGSTNERDSIDIGNSRALRIGGVGTLMPWLELETQLVRASHSLASGIGAVHVGMNRDYYGSGSLDSLLCLYPFQNNGEQFALRNYARLGYNQRNNTLQVQSFRKNTGRAGWTDRENAIRIVSHGYLTWSSEKYKDIIREFDDDVLDTISNVNPYIYSYKADVDGNPELGFILEKGVPELLHENNGESLSSYSMVAYLWRGTRQLIEKMDKQQKEIDKLTKIISTK